MSERYQGYANYKTWACCLWIDNEQGSHEYWREVAQEVAKDTRDNNDADDDADDAKNDAVTALADRMESEFEEAYPAAAVHGVFSDLLRSAFDAIDWHEVAATRFDDDETFVPAAEGDDDE